MFGSDATRAEKDIGDVADGGAVHAPIRRLKHLPLTHFLLRRQAPIIGNRSAEQGAEQAFDRMDPVKAICIKRHDRRKSRVAWNAGEPGCPKGVPALPKQEMHALFV